MNTKQKIIFELERKDFPNLEFLYGEEVLSVATKILDDFLEEEKQDFKNKLKLKNEDITFDTFNEESNLGYFWSLLNHLSNVNGSDKIREIIENFEHKLTEFSNEISYSKKYFKM
jgi:Zn-dependent oligopeptidase